MIELYTGTPGSGKSLHCAKDIYTRINRGKGVVANFDINMTVFNLKKRRKKLGSFLFLDNFELTPDALINYALQNHKRNTNGHITEGQTLLIIDECQILFNSRDWNALDRMKWATFFAQHRKYGYNIILITQFDRLIDRQIRALVEYQVIHRKISNFKTIGFFLGLLFRGNVFVAVTQWYGVREKIDSEFFVLHKKYSGLYDSYKIFNPQAEAGNCKGAPPMTEDEKPSTHKPEYVPVEKPKPDFKEKILPVKNQMFRHLKLLLSKLQIILAKLQIKQNKIKTAISKDIRPEAEYGCLSDFWNVPPPPN